MVIKDLKYSLFPFIEDLGNISVMEGGKGEMMMGH